MNFDRRRTLLTSLLLIVYFGLHYYFLNSEDIYHPIKDSLMRITTSFFCYYSTEHVTFIFSTLFLLARNYGWRQSPLFWLRQKSRGAIINKYTQNTILLSLLVAVLHGAVGVLFTLFVVKNDQLVQNQFYTLALIYTGVLFLYLLIVGLIALNLENFVSPMQAIILTIIIMFSAHFLGKGHWSPVVDLEIFPDAYLNHELTLNELILRPLRLAGISVILYLIGSNFIYRRDFLK
ncbi:WxPxxD family membrane protein [Sporolactobacillus terrae]|uniref:WxPxxD family membrane protein n=1 Tax=Sporolactobacillus terrae TaxID=269673 RepID=UPI0004912650|nr:WxPxxD family membrane protein [Sporolactobacillus terrae]